MSAYRRTNGPRFEKGGPTVEWHIAQRLLFAAFGDVLLLLDCCNASLVLKGNKEYGKFELLAACANDNKTPYPGGTSFSHLLERELRDYAKTGVTVSTLASRLREHPRIRGTWLLCMMV